MKYLYFFTACLIMIFCVPFVSLAKGDVTKEYIYKDSVLSISVLVFSTEERFLKTAGLYNYSHLQVRLRGAPTGKIKTYCSSNNLISEITNSKVYRKARDSITKTEVHNLGSYNK